MSRRSNTQDRARDPKTCIANQRPEPLKAETLPLLMAGKVLRRSAKHEKKTPLQQIGNPMPSTLEVLALNPKPPTFFFPVGSNLNHCTLNPLSRTLNPKLCPKPPRGDNSADLSRCVHRDIRLSNDQKPNQGAVGVLSGIGFCPWGLGFWRFLAARSS